MKHFKKTVFLILFVLLLALTGCGMGEKPIVKIRDLDFTVLKEDDIPKPLMDVIAKNRETEMKLSYQYQGQLYIARGFGTQTTGGYSIAAEQCYLGEDGIHVKFKLIGPSKDKKPKEEPSYPCIVIKTEDLDKEIIFE